MSRGEVPSGFTPLGWLNYFEVSKYSQDRRYGFGHVIHLFSG